MEHVLKADRDGVIEASAVPPGEQVSQGAVLVRFAEDHTAQEERLMAATHENRDDKVSLVEMGPRDGLQNETATLPWRSGWRSSPAWPRGGLQRIEGGAFVSPKKVPQMADSAALFNALPRRGPTRWAPWCPIQQGLAGPPSPHAPTR